jgi:hypothetical protein
MKKLLVVLAVVGTTAGLSACSSGSSAPAVHATAATAAARADVDGFNNVDTLEAGILVQALKSEVAHKATLRATRVTCVPFAPHRFSCRLGLRSLVPHSSITPGATMPIGVYNVSPDGSRFIPQS